MPISFPFHRVAAVAAVLSLAFGLPSWAGPPLALAEALETAVSRSQQIAAQDAVITSAREQAVSAAQLPDPVLKLGVDNLPVNGEDRFSLTSDFMTMRRIGVMQEIPRAQKRQLRAERFERDAQRAQAERHMALSAVQRSTATAWLDRYYTQAMQGLLQRQLEETRLQVQAAETAFGSGRGSQADAFAARAALILLEDRLSQIERQARGASIVLTRWVGAAAERMPSGPPPWQSTPLESAQSVEHLQLLPDIRVLAAKSNHRLNPLFADFYMNPGRPSTPFKLGKAGLFATTVTFAALSCGPPSRFRRLDSVSAGCQFCRVVFARQSVNHGLCPRHKFTLYPRPPVGQVDLDPGYSGNGLQGFGDTFNT